MKKSRMVKRPYSIFQYQENFIQEYSKKEGMNLSEIVRMALDQLKFKVESKNNNEFNSNDQYK